MIVGALRARDLFRYAHLELTGLPAKGTILVRGSNESGKTSIGEAICLALFGRSATIAPDSLRRAVRWGQSSASIDMEFLVGETDRYRITRFFDDSGNHSATLSRVGQDAPLATGVDAVGQAIRRAVGFGYVEFLDTFYLAQGVTESPSSRGQAVKVIVGLDAMERARAEIDAEIATEHGALADLAQRITAANLQIMEVDYQEDRVAHLAAEREQTEATLAAMERELVGADDRSARLDQTRDQLRDVQQQVPITDVSTPYTEWHQYTETLSGALGRLGQVCAASGTDTEPAAGNALRQLNERLVDHLANFQSLRSEAKRYRERLAAELGDGPALAREPSLRQRQVDISEALARVSRRLAHARAAASSLSVAAIGIWGAWFMVGFAPDSGLARHLTAPVDRYLPHWSDGVEPGQFLGLAAVSAAIAVLAVILLVRAATLSGERNGLRQQHQTLAKRIEMARKQVEILDNLEAIPLPDALAALREIPDGNLSRALAEFIQGPDNPLLDPQILTGLFEELARALGNCDASLIAWLDEVQGQRGHLQSEISRLRDHLAAIDSQLAAERAKQPEVENLSRALTDARHQTAQHERRISVREVAGRLLAETASRALAKFEWALQHRLTAVIPQLTAGRYSYVQLAESQLRVFCPEKGDFADLAELSGGTRAQLALAVRLVLGEALEQSGGRSPQCLILDEPFGMFDAQRRANTMATLAKIGGQERQLWLIGHDIEGVGAMEIECLGDRDTLIASGT